MSRDGDHPRVGSTGRTLGARVPHDISADAAGLVHPGTGGMSVAPTWRDLPPHRIPRRLRHLAPEAAGNDADACWRMGEGPFAAGGVAEGLLLRPGRPTHGTIEPAMPMTLGRYQAALATTRERWVVDEE